MKYYEEEIIRRYPDRKISNEYYPEVKELLDKFPRNDFNNNNISVTCIVSECGNHVSFDINLYNLSKELEKLLEKYSSRYSGRFINVFTFRHSNFSTLGESYWEIFLDENQSVKNFNLESCFLDFLTWIKKKNQEEVKQIKKENLYIDDFSKIFDHHNSQSTKVEYYEAI